MAVSALSAEPATSLVLEWLSAAEDVLISDWLLTEAAAALSRKRRMRILSDKEHAQALNGLRDQIGAAFHTLPVTREDFRAAAGFAEQAEIGLRAGDALHLAVAAAAGAALVTLDKGQARAGRRLRVETLLL